MPSGLESRRRKAFQGRAPRDDFRGLRPERPRAERDLHYSSLIFYRLAAELEEPPGEVTVSVDFSDRLGDKSMSFTKLVTAEETYQAVLVPDDPEASFTIGTKPSLISLLGLYVKLGVEHIFLGYDHILFLIALIVLGGRLSSLVKVVTAFTVAHSVTLIVAALELVTLPSRWIESGIALSIAYVAAENFWTKDTDHRWILTFIFGLVHGFGFANVLRELGLPSQGLVSSLLAFNVGVELGQLAIVVLLFPVIIWLTRKPHHQLAVRLVSAVIFLFGMGWLIERVFGFGYMPF